LLRRDIEEIISKDDLKSFIESEDLSSHVAKAIEITEETGNEALFAVFKTLGNNNLRYSPIIEGEKYKVKIDLDELGFGDNGHEYVFLLCHTHPTPQSIPSKLTKCGTDHFSTAYPTGGISFHGGNPPFRTLGLVVSVTDETQDYPSSLKPFHKPIFPKKSQE